MLLVACMGVRADLVALPVVDHAGHLAHVVLAEVHSPGSAVQVREVGAGPAHSRRVDNWRHRVEVVHQQSGQRYVRGIRPSNSALNVHL